MTTDTAQRSDGPSVRDIAQLLNAQAEAVCWMLFPAGKRDGRFFCVGSIHGEPGNSLKVHIQGLKQGGWADYARSPNEPGAKGDMLALIQHGLCGGDIGEAVKQAKRFLAIDSMDPEVLARMQKRAAAQAAKAAAEHENERAKKRRKAWNKWHFASVLTPSSPPVRYLQGRGIDFARLGKIPGCLRFGQAYQCELDRQVPAMLTAFVDEDGHAATHVTYLHREANGDWVKLPGVERQKEIYGPHYWGAHIPLWKGEQRVPLAGVRPGTPIEVAEGIEDGLSYALARPEARVIVAGNVGNIGALRLPPHVGDLIIVAQRDPPGSDAERSLEEAVRAQQEQARAQGSPRAVRLRFPPPGVKDWNDWLRG